MRRTIMLAAAAAAILLTGAADARRHGSGHHSYHHRSYHRAYHHSYHRSYHHRTHHYRPHHMAGHYYRAHSGHYVHSPMHADSRPAGATARCRDGTWSFSESRRGTCSWHGGVAAWVH